MPDLLDPMFSDRPAARLFAMPPGADFAASLVAGLRDRLGAHQPEAMARVHLYVNSARMKAQVEEAFANGPPGFLPQIRLITQFAAEDMPLTNVAPALRRRLELRELVARLVQTTPDLAPASAVPDLTVSLAALLEEMEDEGVSPQALLSLDTTDASGHWQQALRFLSILTQFTETDSAEAPSPARFLRHHASAVIQRWQAAPPAHPVIVAGSTGSRGTTAMIMQAVARLPQGALVLPGFDWHQPHIWPRLMEFGGVHDHPQFRYAALLDALNVTPGEVQDWGGPITPAQAARNKLVSLSLRPAPVTHEWRNTPPDFTDIALATAGMSLLKADNPRHEAQAISLAMRDALEQGRTVALITPDQNLTRLVHAALDRWQITPDASIGGRLSQMPPGQLMRLILRAMDDRRQTRDIIVLLKHPLVARGGDRGTHIDLTRRFEIWARAKSLAHVTTADLQRWLGKLGPDLAKKASVWVTYWARALFEWPSAEPAPLSTRLARHLALAKALVAGPFSQDGSELFAKQSGQELARFVTELAAEAAHSGPLRGAEYADLIEDFLSRIEARDAVTAREDVKIWGTLEARVQSADLVILGGLNQNVWPEQPGADPWLNRAMRQEAGLRLPDRAIGLSAHDYQQAIAARHVILSRSLRDDEAETIPSRWLNRLDNLLSGLSTPASEALKQMVERGDFWANLARGVDMPATAAAAAPRPAPAPPVKARPRQLSVTDIQKLIRDPYHIYARKILRLRPLNPIVARPDPRYRGIVLHHVFEALVDSLDFASVSDTLRGDALEIAQAVLDKHVPWPEARVMWRARLDPVLDGFVLDEVRRQAEGRVLAKERGGSLYLGGLDFTLTAKADRIDEGPDGRAVIYDYKSSVPTAPVVKHFDKQLMLEALILEAGGFEGLPPLEVAQTAYIPLTKPQGAQPRPISEEGLTAERARLEALLAAFFDPDKGYGALRAMKSLTYGSDYAHLARHGEWDETDEFTLIRVT